MFDLKRPCENCPFRREPRFHGLRRAPEIALALRQGGNFHCHKTVDYPDDFDGTITPKSQMCAGAMMVLEREDTVFVNQMARISGRLGMLSPDFPDDWYDYSIPVYDSFDEFIECVNGT